MMANEMRDRLVELIQAKQDEITLCGSYAEYLADSILNDGWIRPPCKVGDKVYYPSGLYDRVFEKTVDEILLNENESDKGYYIHFASTYMPFENIGKTVFLTKAEAEQKLKEMRGG